MAIIVGVAGNFGFAPCLVGLAILGLLLEFGNLCGDFGVYPVLQLWTIAQEEENLEPHKHRGEEQCLDEIVHQSWGPALKSSVSDKLSDPADDMNGDCRGQG